MTWLALTPPIDDPLVHLNLPHSGPGPSFLLIDKLPDGRYRATVGTLFQAQELARTADLERLLRASWGLQNARSSREVLRALLAMRDDLSEA